MATDKILVIGANGQIGSALVGYLQNHYGERAVIPSDLREPKAEIAQFEKLDVTDAKRLSEVVSKHNITQIYHLAAILSANGESEPLATWDINTRTYFNVLEVARNQNIRKIFFPSSIAVFGPEVDRDNTSQWSYLAPETAYGLSKAASETWSKYYHLRYGMDIRSLRYPGIISYQSAPGGGTTDYAVDIYHKAVRNEPFTCFLKAGTTLPMIYMDDSLRATLELMEAEAEKIKIRTSYNLQGMSFNPTEVADSIKKIFPSFKITYKPDFRQKIAESWPKQIDDSEARADWSWKPRFHLPQMTAEMVAHLTKKYTHA